MNTVHLHLMLTHVPALGTLFAALLLAAGIVRRSDELKKVAFWAFVVCALSCIPVYLTGEPSQKMVQALPGVSKGMIESHEDIAQVAFVVILSLGGVALVGLAFIRKRAVPQWFAVSVLTLAVATTGLLGWTANLGGKVRHTEITNGSAGIAIAPTGDRD